MTVAQLGPKPIPLLTVERIQHVRLVLDLVNRDGNRWGLGVEMTKDIYVTLGRRVIVELDRAGKLMVACEELSMPLDPEEVFCNEEIGA